MSNRTSEALRKVHIELLNKLDEHIAVIHTGEIDEHITVYHRNTPEVQYYIRCEEVEEGTEEPRLHFSVNAEFDTFSKYEPVDVELIPEYMALAVKAGCLPTLYC